MRPFGYDGARKVSVLAIDKLVRARTSIATLLSLSSISATTGERTCSANF